MKRTIEHLAQMSSERRAQLILNNELMFPCSSFDVQVKTRQRSNKQDHTLDLLLLLNVLDAEYHSKTFSTTLCLFLPLPGPILLIWQ